MEKPYDEFEVGDYLKDKDFLIWRFFKTEESEAFWNGFTERYPGQRENLKKAIHITDSTSVKSVDLTAREQDEIEDIYFRTRELYKRRKQKVRHLSFCLSAAACLALICMIAGLFPFQHKLKDEIVAEVVSDSMLKGIQLIFGPKDIVCFEKNTDIIINEDGRIQVAVNMSDTTSFVKEVKNGQPVKLIVPEGKQSSLVLSDGTRIWVNAGSAVSFPSAFTGKTRKISLEEGEVYLEVTHDKKKPFMVNTSFGEVKVLGTRFNISDYRTDEVKSVVLAEGLVEVKMAESKGLILKPNQMLSIASETYDIKQVDIYDHICWKDGVIQFSNETLETLMSKLSRYYGVEFVSDELLKQKKCTGKMVLFDSMTDVLNTLSDIFHIQYRIVDNKVELFNN